MRNFTKTPINTVLDASAIEAYKESISKVKEDFLKEATKACLDNRQTRIDIIAEFDDGIPTRVYTDVMPSGTYHMPSPNGIEEEAIYSKEYNQGFCDELYMEILEEQNSPVYDENGELYRTNDADKVYTELERDYLKEEVDKAVDDFCNRIGLEL